VPEVKGGKVVGVGVGPGDPDLLTVKAIRAIQEADVVCAPTPNSAGHSVALDIIRPVLEGRQQAPEVVTLVFPMVRDEAELERAWAGNTDRIAKYAQKGKQVAFVAVGDPSLYSTFTYVARMLKVGYPEIPVEIIPGVTSLSACMARARIPLAFGEETLLIMPRSDMDLLKEESRLVDNIVWMKGVKRLPEIVSILKESGRFSDESQIVIAKRCSFSDEEEWKGRIRDAPHLKLAEDYFATMIVRRRPSDA
jgi:precorrin-2/cobalt-factor-2 C20-methyltransferase